MELHTFEWMVHPRGGVGHSLIWPIRVWATEPDMFSRSWDLNRIYNLTFEAFKKGWRLAICNTNNFFLYIYFHAFSVKNYLIPYAKQSKSGSESRVTCLKQGRRMSNFVLNRIGVWRPRRCSFTEASDQLRGKKLRVTRTFASHWRAKYHNA